MVERQHLPAQSLPNTTLPHPKRLSREAGSCFGRFWKSVGTIILGIMIGVSGLFLSLIAAKMRYQELEEAGNKITNDMFGYGQVLVGGLGLIYFLGVFLVTLIITAFRFFQTWRQV